MTGPQLKATVEQLFSVVRDRSTEQELVFVCPVPGCGDESGNRSVNLRTGKTNCWRCNKGGDFVKWARFLGYSVEESGATVGTPLEQIDMRPWTLKRDQAPIVKEIPLPTGFHYCEDYPNNVYTQLIGEMAERKNLSLQDLLMARVGFTKDDPKWEPYAIFPVFDYGRTVYWQGRTYDDVPGEPTKRFPDRGEAPYGAKYWVYGIDELRAEESPIVLVMESILNVLSIRRYMRENGLTGVTPVSVFKHYLSAPQTRKIIELPFVKEICLLYDHDATMSAWEKSPRISNYVRTTVAQMPPGPGGEKNDPNDDPVTAWRVFEQRQKANKLNQVMASALGHRQKMAKPVDAPIQASPLDRLQITLRSIGHESKDQPVRRPGRFSAGG